MVRGKRGWRKLQLYLLQSPFMLRIAYFLAAPVLLCGEFAIVTRKGSFTLAACTHSILCLLAVVIFVACVAFMAHGEDAVQLFDAMAMFNRNFTGYLNIERVCSVKLSHLFFTEKFNGEQVTILQAYKNDRTVAMAVIL